MIIDNPLISVIVPNYNHEKYLNQRLDSIFNQTYPNFEVILLDDCSKDNSSEILSAYSKNPKVSHCIFNEENSGNTFAQWNKGVLLAKGDFIWVAESDDYCDTIFLETLVKPLIEDAEIALSYCQSYRADSDGVVIGNWITHTSNFQPNPLLEDFVMPGNIFIEKYLIHKNVIPNASAVLIRKTHLFKIMPLEFKPFLKYNADWFYYVQLICNAKVGFIEKSLNYFRYHQASVIAKADGESGTLKIYEMEHHMRVFMFNFIKTSKPQNIKAIKKQYKTGNRKLYFEKTNIYLKKGAFFDAFSYAFPNIPLLIHISQIILIKVRNRFVKQ